MHRAFRAAVLTALVVCPYPVLADCVSCGSGGECFTTSPGFSGNCECKIRSLNGVAICKPSGVCDPNDATSCSSDQFPQVIASRGKIATPFLNDLARRDPFLSGAVWAGIEEENSSPKPDFREVTGTMGKDGRRYTYRARVQPLAEGSVSLTAHVAEDGAAAGQDYEGEILDAGQSGHFVKVDGKGRPIVFSWDTRHPGER